jgi:RES domain-containing protein
MGSRFRGPLRAFRVADRRHPVFDGGGAAIHGGRWNSPGHRIIYASISFAGALLERLALAGTGMIPRNQDYLVIDLGKDIEIEQIEPIDVPDWDSPDQIASRAFGDQWISDRRTPALVVPSVVGQPYERNLVINQDHADFPRVRTGDTGPVMWDARILRAIRGG